MKKLFLTLLLLGSFLKADDNTENTLFFQGLVGASLFNINENVSGIILRNDTFHNTGSLFELGIGYGITDNCFSTINFQESSLNNVLLNNYYISLNYVFEFPMNQNIKRYIDYSDLIPFAGMLAGQSTLTWNESPIQNTTSTNSSSSKYYYGIILGLSHLVNDNLYWNFKYQFNLLNHSTKINTYSIDHKYENLILVGLNYKMNLF